MHSKLDFDDGAHLICLTIKPPLLMYHTNALLSRGVEACAATRLQIELRLSS